MATGEGMKAPVTLEDIEGDQAKPFYFFLLICLMGFDYFVYLFL